MKLVAASLFGFILASTSLPGATRVWDGEGSTVNWRDGGNWEGNDAPDPGDALVFPSRVSEMLNFNDYAERTLFRSILIQDDYRLEGNQISLSGGITNSGFATISLPVSVVASQIWLQDSSGDLLLTHEVVIDSGADLTFPGSGPITFDGALLGSGLMTQDGTSRLVFQGDSPGYTGLLDLQQGRVEVNADVSGMAVSQFGGILEGSGSIGRLMVDDGVVRPGDGVGILAVESPVLERSGTLSIELGTEMPGTGHDQLMVNGTLTLNGPTLDLTLLASFNPAPGQTFLIVSNDGDSDAIHGKFDGLNEGDTFPVGDALFRIGYRGGDGNDVVLETLIPVTGIIRVWNGEGGDNRWMTDANWEGDESPGPGDDLLFISGRPQMTNMNDFPEGTLFGSIQVDAPAPGMSLLARVQLEGNRIDLAAGILVRTNFRSFATVDCPLVLLAEQRFSVSNRFARLVCQSTVDLGGHTARLDGYVHFIGQVSGAGGLALEDGLLALTGTNTFAGPVEVLKGTAFGGYHPHALGSDAQGTRVADGAYLDYSWLGQIDEVLLLGGALHIFLNFGTQHWTAPVVVNSSNAVIGVRNSQVTLQIDQLNGSGQLTKVADGILLLSGVNEFSGPIVVTNGTLIVEGAIPGAGIVLAHSGSLAGTGEVGSVESASEGNTVLDTAIEGTGVLTVLGGLTLGAGTTVKLRLDGTTPDTAYDQLHVFGQAVLNQPRLNVVLDFFPLLNSTFMLVQNDGSDPVAGEFMDLPEGALFETVTGTRFRISYQGGDGNDVTLTVVLQSSLGTRRFWDGNGSDALWTTAENWIGNVAPTPGDDLIFAPDPLQTICTNDYPEGTSFNSIQFGGTSYGIHGQLLALNAGVISTNIEPISNGLIVPLRLTGSQTFHTATNNFLILGRIDNNGYDLTLDGEGSMTFGGEVQGSGSLVKPGAGLVWLTESNSYSGLTRVESGQMRLSDPHALGGTGGHTVVLPGARLTIFGFSTPYPEFLELRGTLETDLSSGAWSGTILLPGPEQGIVRSASSFDRLSLKGLITGPGGLLVESGQVILEGQAVHTGETSLGRTNSFPSLTVDGFISESLLRGYGGVLRGTGQIADAQLAGTRIEPGSFTSPSLTVNGNIEFLPFSRLECQALFVEPPAYTRLVVHGACVIRSNVILSAGVSENFMPPLNEPFILVENWNGEPIDGTFRDYTEGITYASSGHIRRFSYLGGDGNDVTVTHIGPPFTSIVCREDGAKLLSGLGIQNTDYILDATTDLLSPIPWGPIQTNRSASGGQLEFIDADAVFFPARYYRMRPAE